MYKPFDQFLHESLNEQLVITKTQSANFLKAVKRGLRSKTFSTEDEGDHVVFHFDNIHFIGSIVNDTVIITHYSMDDANYKAIPQSVNTAKEFSDFQQLQKFYKADNSKSVTRKTAAKSSMVNIGSDIEDLGIVEYVDGLTPKDVKKHFPWLLKAKFKDAVIGMVNNKLIWHNGIWESGTFKDGLWVHGVWNGGTWESGIWEGGTWNGGTWNGGTWRDGTWNGGTWNNGEWLYGVWKDGVWESGIWNDGIWKGGKWHDGIWKGSTEKHPKQ